MLPSPTPGDPPPPPPPPPPLHPRGFVRPPVFQRGPGICSSLKKKSNSHTFPAVSPSPPRPTPGICSFFFQRARNCPHLGKEKSTFSHYIPINSVCGLQMFHPRNTEGLTNPWGIGHALVIEDCYPCSSTHTVTFLTWPWHSFQPLLPTGCIYTSY